jgi:hypothetical protein
MRDHGIADRLRHAGLTVVEVAGWQTRGSEDFNPTASVDHHTAGSRLGNAPSLNICIYGRSDLPGPLCHVLVARDNTCYVIAAGRANHAGEGGWAGLTGNSSVYGVERENVGTVAEPWTDEQTRVAAKVHAALIRTRTTFDKVCRHAEWAPTRKIDTHSIEGDALRAAVRRELTGGSNDMTVPEWAKKAWKWATDRKVVDGTRPNDPVTRAEMVTILHRIVEAEGKAPGWVEWPPREVMSRDRPNAVATRAEVATGLAKLRRLR